MQVKSVPFSVLSTARLETRTKEFELLASDCADCKHTRGMKVNIIELRFFDFMG